jgi:hypothetical protein
MRQCVSESMSPALTSYCSNGLSNLEQLIGPSKFPGVVKVGHAHAGMGKMKIHDHHDFEDFSSVMALSNDYVTAEPFYEGVYDIRIQKIGDRYRAFKRTCCCMSCYLLVLSLRMTPLTCAHYYSNMENQYLHGTDRGH